MLRQEFGEEWGEVYGRYLVDGVQYTVQYTIYNMGGAQYTLVGGGVQQVHGGLCTLYSSRGRTTLGTWLMVYSTH